MEGGLQKGNVSVPPVLREGGVGFVGRLRPPLVRERKRVKK